MYTGLYLLILLSSALSILTSPLPKTEASSEDIVSFNGLRRHLEPLIGLHEDKRDVGKRVTRKITTPESLFERLSKRILDSGALREPRAAKPQSYRNGRGRREAVPEPQSYRNGRGRRDAEAQSFRNGRGRREAEPMPQSYRNGRGVDATPKLNLSETGEGDVRLSLCLSRTAMGEVGVRLCLNPNHIVMEGVDATPKLNLSETGGGDVKLRLSL
ncbi:hypothetical protein SVAN01_10346 [Stagonosporopsis vannaccii]|nr:hypothetical protein SVAN01_10346 [Stagonosporopsis vannaccii]